MSEPATKKLKQEEFQPRLRSIKTLWGVDGGDDPKEWTSLFARIKAEGFDAVEAPPPHWQTPGFTDALKEAGLELIAQLHTTSFVKDGWAGFRYNTSCSVKDHLASLKELSLAAQKTGAFLINSHSGCDSWSIEEAREFLRGALVIEKEIGLAICHETHRRRLFWNPFYFRDILKGQEDLKDIKINLDISHWVVCLERIFDSPESRQMNGDDGWWGEVLGMLKNHCWLIHARVGYDEGPQVPDPAAPEFSAEVKCHMGWWEEIMKAMIAQKRVCNVEPEHGPWPYQQSVPSTGMKPNHDIWESNKYVIKLVKERWPAIVESLKV